MVTRKEKRIMEKEANFFFEIMKTKEHFFKDIEKCSFCRTGESQRADDKEPAEEEKPGAIQNFREVLGNYL